MSRRTALVGNRLVLVGAVLYLLEWVAIIGAGVGVPLGATASAHDVLAGYAGHADALGWAAGWFAVVELGRVLLMVGLRSALAESERPHRLMDVAVAAMAVSVALEVVVYAVSAGASWSLAHGGSLATTRALDAVAFQTNLTVYGPIGVSLLCAGVAMWCSGLFARALSGLGLVAGLLFTVMGLALEAPRFAQAVQAISAAALIMWIWMVWTGVVTWRARPRVARPRGADDTSTYDLTTA
ncbi:hypothetical protein [Nocardioides panaciterrulae]|uniref:DUF4386 family protein n=1 Tax=Nocardioides panaciterrulae TaxID=661492 RepID=A0A7Y9E542_9ACTN|nr:hypothetical protein [Nocardioides panaciterrulae]NYD41090.1 hypothetical protein [Nocardioides panaciterrulae]